MAAPASPQFHRTHETVQELRQQLTDEFAKIYGVIAGQGEAIQQQKTYVDQLGQRMVQTEVKVDQVVEVAKATIASAGGEFEGHRTAILALAQGSREELELLKTELFSTQVQAKQEFQTQRDQLQVLQEQARAACSHLEGEVGKLKANIGVTATLPVQPSGDPWQAAAAQLPPPGISTVASRGTTQGGGGAGQRTMNFAMDSSQEEKRVTPDVKVIMNMTKLRPDTSLQDYHSWKRLAKSAITGGRPEVSALLRWAEIQESPITQDKEQEGARAADVALDPVQASAAIFAGLMHGIAPDILDSRCRLAGEDRGLELWRLLVQEHESTSTQSMLKKQKAFQNPRRCKDLKELVRILPSWLQLEKELEVWCPLGDRVKQVALHELLPASMLADLRKNLAITTFSDELRWTKVQCQFEKDDELTASIGDDPMMIGTLQESPAQTGAAEEPTPQQVLLNALQGIEASLLALGGKSQRWKEGKGEG